MTAVYAVALVAGFVLVLLSLLSNWEPSFSAVLGAVWAFGLGGMSATFAGWPGWLALAAALVAAAAVFFWANRMRTNC